MTSPPTYGPVTVTGLAVSQNSGTTYEALINLLQGQIIGTWDKSKLINQFVNSGEILFDPDTTYSGRPIAPVLLTPALAFQGGNGLVTLTWAQERFDLCDGYTVQYSLDGVTYNLLTQINSGAIQTVTVPASMGLTYWFRVQALSLDGPSAYSNVQEVWIGLLSAPTISAITGVAASGMASLDGFGNNFGVDFGGANGYAFTLNWTLTTPGAAQISSYTLQMQMDGGTFSTIGVITPGTVTSFSTVALAGGHVYGFRISAYVPAQSKSTAFSPVVFITVPLDFPLLNPVGVVHGVLLTPGQIQYVAAYGVAPYTFALVGSGFPPGLSMNSSGAVSGTPTVPTVYTFYVQVTDSAVPSPFTDIVLQSITVA